MQPRTWVAGTLVCEIWQIQGTHISQDYCIVFKVSKKISNGSGVFGELVFNLKTEIRDPKTNME